MAKDKKSDKKSGKHESKHDATSGDVTEEEHSTSDEGNFSFGYCKSCKWRGRARRSRDKARRDAKEHSSECTGKGNIKLKRTDHKD